MNNKYFEIDKETKALTISGEFIDLINRWYDGEKLSDEELGTVKREQIETIDRLSDSKED